MSKKFSFDKLNIIIDELLASMNKSKKKAVKFYESTLEQVKKTEEELSEVIEKMAKINSDISKNSVQSRKHRDKLLNITKLMATNVDKYQQQYEHSYIMAENLMSENIELENKYKMLFEKRNYLDREIVMLKTLLVDTKDLVQSIATSARYIDDDLSDIGVHLSEKEAMILKIIEAGEREKKSISRDIHDGPSQVLALLKIELQILKSKMGEDVAIEIKNKINDIDGHIQGLLIDIRRIIYDLRPMSLDDLGLIPTIENLIKEFNETKGIKSTLEIINMDKKDLEISDSISVVIFRVIQESLSNVFNHSGATEVDVKLELAKNNLNVLIIDNGKGFDVDKKLKNSQQEGSFGLIGMTERVAIVDGEIKITSREGFGTKIQISIPYSSRTTNK